MARIHEHGYWIGDAEEWDVFDSFLAQEIHSLLPKDVDVLDLGCGPGDYVRYFRRSGRVAFGCDGNPEVVEQPWCCTADLSVPVEIGRRDWVICLEVGEHIPVEYETNFLDNVSQHCRLGVILSWATPGQPGIGHVNCRPNSHVIQQMESRGLFPQEHLARHLRAAARAPWFKNTIMVFKRSQPLQST